MDKYEYIVNSSRDFITLINQQYVYEIVNDTYCEIVEKNKTDVLGATVADVWGRETFENTIKGYLDRCFAGEQVHYIEQFRFGSILKYMHVSYYPYSEGDSVTHALVFSHDITHIGELENKLNHYEYRDPITGLFNRRSLNVILDRELERARRSESERLRVLLFIDLLTMEKVVQMHGQEIGDLLLENTGIRISSQLRRSDYIFRFEGNRFVVLLPKVTNKLDAGTVANKIHQKVSIPYNFRNTDISVACSIGAAVYPDDGYTRDALIQNAISAMIEAGKNHSEFLLFNTDMHKQATERIYLESSAYRGLEEKQFEIFYQPIVDSAFRIVGAEALLRWNHPELGNISPMLFIPIAEQSGLILTIGKWVLFNVCSQLAKWSRTEDIFVSLNMSAREFSSSDLKENILTAMSRSGLDNPDRLKIEITETSCIHMLEETIANMNVLNEIGVNLYIDDFGTGQSSLRYLKQLPARVLKIDREFVEGIEKNEDDRAFLSHIIQIVKSRGKEVVAEGVGNSEQAGLLVEMGCNRMQGFYFSRPLPAEDFEALLDRTATLP